MLSGIRAILFLCLKIANIHLITPQSTYETYANFDNIGDLKIHSPVKIVGMVIEKVSNLSFKGPNYTPRVTINIDSQYYHIPDSITSYAYFWFIRETIFGIAPGF